MFLSGKWHMTAGRLTARKSTVFLLVEDDPNDVFIIEQEFKRAGQGIRLSTVHDGIEARRYLEGDGEYGEREKFPLPDVILLDLKMPRFSGFDFLEWLRYKGPQHLNWTPVVVVSSSALQKDVDRAYALGVNSYIVKPVEWKLFRERIKALGVYWGEHVETPRPPIQPARTSS
jgi:CheY-like chemotaxis protein